MWRPRTLVTEDVVELVAATTTLEPAHVWTLAVAVLERALGRRVVVLEILGLVGEAEVNERAMPGVTEWHGCESFRGGVQGSYCSGSCLEVHPRRFQPVAPHPYSTRPIRT